MKIYLFCSAGMSTSLLVTKMVKAAEETGLEAHIEAFSQSEAATKGPEADIILLGPQIRFQLGKTKEMFPNKVVEVIDMRDYGMVNGAKVLEDALAKFNA